MSIVAFAPFVEADHGIVFLKTDDGEVHALEFGSHHESSEKHNHHDKTHDNKHDHVHSQGHQKHEDKKEEHAEHTKSYGIHCWSPIGSRPGTIAIPEEFVKAAANSYSAETLNHELKHEWHQKGAEQKFHDAGSFVKHVTEGKLQKA